MTNRFMHGWTPPRQSHQFCIFVSAWRCFFYPPSPRACHYIYPCSLLSANTFTFLVLLSNKRGGMSGGLLPLLKQTSMNSPHWEVTPPPNSPISPSTHPQFGRCSTVQVNSVAVWVSSVSLTVLTLISRFTNKSVPHTGGSTSVFCPSCILCRHRSKNVEKTFCNHKLPSEVTG